eukprot:TRINITY_DN67326_c0_g1_i1.p1 TRINITY_DN67326_c0_g1~~TRINITY_DN67326_c0_g1_i1.p1  ORF type:complete len:646 (-),score=61.41 TRINITY_DN67326_c0_g1_i1:144-2027(-)
MTVPFNVLAIIWFLFTGFGASLAPGDSGSGDSKLSRTTSPLPLSLIHGASVGAADTRKASETCQHGHSSDGACVCQYPRVLRNDSQGKAHCAIKDCGHGNYSFESGLCDCFSGWRIAGPSNPLGYLIGRCDQFQCQSHVMCREKLGLEEATCPVSGWNCDCGLLRAGFGTESARCMFPWWALAAKLTTWATTIFRWLWFVTLWVAAVLLPFGKNVIGSADGCSISMLKDDFAWSRFALELGVWLYLMVGYAYLLSALIWLSCMVAALFVVLGCLALGACCMAAAAFGEGVGGFCSAADPCAASCECIACDGAENACCCCCNEALYCSPFQSDLVVPAALYYDPICFMGVSPRDCDTCCCCCGPSCRNSRIRHVIEPFLRHLLSAFPTMPQNMLGGLVGFILGTHALRNRYDPNSRLVRALAMPCRSFTNRGDRWRGLVYEWLHERDASEAVALSGTTVAEMQRDSSSGGGSPRMIFGSVVVDRQSGEFTSSDHIFNYDDYEANLCWICQTPADRWDLWTVCRHAFCERCSSEMLRRRMPCPLCRVRSNRVQRREAKALEMESLEASLESGNFQDCRHAKTRAVVNSGRCGSSSSATYSAVASVNSPEPQRMPPVMPRNPNRGACFNE